MRLVTPSTENPHGDASQLPSSRSLHTDQPTVLRRLDEAEDVVTALSVELRFRTTAVRTVSDYPSNSFAMSANPSSGDSVAS
jgi:hypothetical protein